MKKYEFTGETIEVSSRTLRRIRALQDFGDVKKGDLGGWIERKKNLSHEDNCWVGGDAKVYGDAQIYGDADVSGDTYVYGNAKVYGSACIYDAVKIFRNAQVCRLALICGNTRIPQDIKI
ncbi:hypothetical protein [Bartonella machadoae]|uniref:hypothetical protein n=1 Tax=Bartonella machadoae TaxID=2893471 RepID=UPI001F4C6A87|nr:hypothetical protein [Bartonella machadoae]UNE53613.1 hypothetical protein LNM86_08140 [Bartonella machadoae]